MVLALAVLASSLGVTQARALEPHFLHDNLFPGHPPAQDQDRPLPVARYVSDEGDSFIFDRSQPQPLLKFDDSGEVWALRAHPAPRGDVIYVNDLDQPVLRATRLGGLTLFTNERPGGTAAAQAGSVGSLRIVAMGPQQLLERLAQASARTSRAARRLIAFEADASPASATLTADAAMIASEALIRLARTPDSRALLARVLRVHLSEGQKSRARLQQGTIEITVAPSEGFAGRPSSDRIIAVAGGR